MYPVSLEKGHLYCVTLEFVNKYGVFSTYNYVLKWAQELHLDAELFLLTISSPALIF